MHANTQLTKCSYTNFEDCWSSVRVDIHLVDASTYPGQSQGQRVLVPWSPGKQELEQGWAGSPPPRTVELWAGWLVGGCPVLQCPPQSVLPGQQEREIKRVQIRFFFNMNGTDIFNVFVTYSLTVMQIPVSHSYYVEKNWSSAWTWLWTGPTCGKAVQQINTANSHTIRDLTI